MWSKWDHLVFELEVIDSRNEYTIKSLVNVVDISDKVFSMISSMYKY